MAIATLLWNANPLGTLGGLYIYFVVGFIEGLGDSTIVLHILLGLILVTYPIISLLRSIKHREENKLVWTLVSVLVAFLAFQVLLIK